MPLGSALPEGALEGGLPGLGAQQAFWGQVGRGNARWASPDPMVLEGSPHHLPPLLPPSHAPRNHEAGGDPGEWRARLGSPAVFPGLEERGKYPLHLPGSSSPRGPLPPASPLLPPPSAYTPRTNVARRGPRRVEDPAWEPHRLPGPNWAGKFLGRSGFLQAWEPLPTPSHPSGTLVLSSLHCSSPLTLPTSYLVAQGFFLSP